LLVIASSVFSSRARLFALGQTDLPTSLYGFDQEGLISLLKTLSLGNYRGYRRRYIRRYLDDLVSRFNRRQYRPVTFHLVLGFALKTEPMPLLKIKSDPIDDGKIIPALLAPPPSVLPSNAVTHAQRHPYKRWGFMLPDRTPECETHHPSIDLLLPGVGF
jgi:hypothetical protein